MKIGYVRVSKKEVSMNYFAKQEAATRYVSSRPNIHPMVMTHIKTFLSLPYPLSRALDVGCGTGQSSLALTTLASEVFGVDASLAMLQEAVQDARIQYRHASAESLPFPTSSFPMMTVAIAFHWFHRPLFLAVASRVLHTGGQLVLDNGGLIETPLTNLALTQWYGEQFLTRFPVPPNYNTQPLAQDEARHYAFQLIGKERYTLPVQLSPETFVQYLMSMSLVTAALEQRQWDARDLEQKLLGEVKALWSSHTDNFLFGGTIEYWQKDANSKR